MILPGVTSLKGRWIVSDICTLPRFYSRVFGSVTFSSIQMSIRFFPLCVCVDQYNLGSSSQESGESKSISRWMNNNLNQNKNTKINSTKAVKYFPIVLPSRACSLSLIDLPWFATMNEWERVLLFTDSEFSTESLNVVSDHVAHWNMEPLSTTQFDGQVCWSSFLGHSSRRFDSSHWYASG